jgi:tol-pal system protein YbgF
MTFFTVATEAPRASRRRGFAGAPIAAAVGTLAAVISAMALLGAPGPARAGIFDDEEARKAILEMRSRINRNDETTRAALDELRQSNTQLLEEIQQLRRTLVDLNTRLDAQRAETADLRGQQEQQARELADTQKQLKDALGALDARIRAFEPQQITVDGKTFTVVAAERAAYDAAIERLRAADFAGAAKGLTTFLRRHPDSGYVDSARFWLGNAQYGQKDYKGAIDTFNTLIEQAPGHLRAPEAMLALANSQAEARDLGGARRTLAALIKAHPDTDAAKAGEQRLAALKR